MKEEENKPDRRKFLKLGLMASGTLAVGAIGLEKVLSKEKDTAGNPITTVMTPDGKVYKADPAHLHEFHAPP